MAPSPALTQTPQSPDVYRAIAYVMKEIGKDGISKDRKNQQQGYSFRGIDEVMNALNPILADAALVIMPRMMSRTQDERTTAKGGVLFYVVVEAQFDFVSAKDGSMHTAAMYGEAMDSADKATNKAMSAALKYACLQVFCIPTEGMEDADETTHAPVPKQQSAAPAQHREPSYKGGAQSLARFEADHAATGEPPSFGPKRETPDELKIVFANLAKDKRHFDTARDSYKERLSVANGAAAFTRLMTAYDALPKRTAADAKTLLLDLHAALTEAESRIGATA